MSVSPSSATPAMAGLCHDLAALMIEHADQLTDLLSLANFISLYGYYIEHQEGSPPGIDEFVFDGIALARAAEVASRDSGQRTSAPDPLKRPPAAPG